MEFVVIITIIMRHHPPLPVLQRLLVTLGENLRYARLRRRFSAAMVSERAGMTRNTLRSVERGSPGVAIGAYAKVLLCMGLEKDLELIGRDDALGRKLQDADLPLKARAPKHGGA